MPTYPAPQFPTLPITRKAGPAIRSAVGGSGWPTDAMTPEIAAGGLQPVLAELRQMRESMATKAELAGLATKADLDRSVTQQRTMENERRLERAEFELWFIKMCCSMLVKTAIIVVLIVGLVSLLK